MQDSKGKKIAKGSDFGVSNSSWRSDLPVQQFFEEGKEDARSVGGWMQDCIIYGIPRYHCFV